MAKRKARTTLEHSSSRKKGISGANRQTLTAKSSPALNNTVASNPLLGKGTVHGKTKKANRRADKVSLLKAFRKSGGRDGEGYLQSDNILQIVFLLPSRNFGSFRLSSCSIPAALPDRVV